MMTDKIVTEKKYRTYLFMAVSKLLRMPVSARYRVYKRQKARRTGVQTSLFYSENLLSSAAIRAVVQLLREPCQPRLWCT